MAEDDTATIAAELDDPLLNRLVDAAKRGDARSLREFKARVQDLQQQAELAASRTASQRDTLQASFERFQQDIDLQNADLAKINQLVRETDATRVLYETFLARLKETSVQVGLQQADTRILSAAIPGKVVRPRKAMILAMSMILGGLLGTGLVFWGHFRVNSFRNAEDLEQATGYTVLGQIPMIPIRHRGNLVKYLADKPTSAASEAIRNLRTSVLLSNIDNPPKVIMSTSSVPGEGKTTQAIALAHNLAGLGKKVLLVDGDIRRRTFDQYFKKAAPGGLVAVVAGDLSINDAVLHDKDVGADILMGEKSTINAADLYSSAKFHSFISDVREIYDFVIIDTPPVLVVTDARVMARFVDAILYTVKWDRTDRSQVTDGLRQFSSLGTPVSGLVLSQIDARRMKRYGYGGNYGAYAGYGKGYYDT